jgi:hypothetical protein
MLERGRAHDDAQIRTLGQDARDVAEQQVHVKVALVGLVEDERVVGPEQRVALDLGQEDAVGHELDVGGRRRPVGEADLALDLAAELHAELGAAG